MPAMPSIAEMTFEELLSYKNHMHRLQTEFRIEAENTDSAARRQRLWGLLRRVEMRLDVVYAEIGRRVQRKEDKLTPSSSAGTSSYA
jgi:hypothetical protein